VVAPLLAGVAVVAAGGQPVNEATAIAAAMVKKITFFIERVPFSELRPGRKASHTFTHQAL